jgi:hypothetical protein
MTWRWCYGNENVRCGLEDDGSDAGMEGRHMKEVDSVG